MFLILLTSFLSADIITKQEPNELYNLGDVVQISYKVTTSNEINGFFTTNLICNGIETEFFRQYLTLKAGEEVSLNPSLPLNQEFLGRSSGVCKIKSQVGEESTLTKDFKISNSIKIEILGEDREFNPLEQLTIEGEAKKENGKYSQGFVEANITSSNISKSIKLTDTINNGYFFLNYSLPEDMPAGEYSVKINVYEKDSTGAISNKGFAAYNIQVNQIPTNVEIAFENTQVEPGTDVKVKAILRDQTGEKIDTQAIITIKDSTDKILTQVEKKTNTYLEYPIKYNEAPSEFHVFAVSEKLNAKSTFNITQKQKVETEIINGTLFIRNKGNVPYNNSVSIKIGDETLKLEAFLEVDEEQKYQLTAPDGTYNIEVLADGESFVVEGMPLTGKAIDIREAGGLLVRYPFVWIFILIILALVAYLLHKKGYKKIFVGYKKLKDRKKSEPKKEEQKPENKKTNEITSALLTASSKNKAIMSLSMKGEKHNSALVCLKIKNYDEIKKVAQSNEMLKEYFKKINDFADSHKAFAYENNDNLFFILSPRETKTMQNEKTALLIASKIKETLNAYNKLAKQKIEFGVSVDYGEVLTKKQGHELHFMGMSNIMPTSKKIASQSSGEILINKEFNERIMSEAKTEKAGDIGNSSYYKIKEFRDREKNKKFISEFVKRLEKDNN